MRVPTTLEISLALCIFDIEAARRHVVLLRTYWSMPEPCMDEQEVSMHQRMNAWNSIRCICVDSHRTASFVYR